MSWTHEPRCLHCPHTSDPYDSHDVRGLLCQRDRCGHTIVYPVTYQGLGCFCSHRCAEIVSLERDVSMKRRA